MGQVCVVAVLGDIKLAELKFGQFWPEVFGDCVCSVSVVGKGCDMLLLEGQRYVENCGLFFG